jgi:hypothetical protein
LKLFVGQRQLAFLKSVYVAYRSFNSILDVRKNILDSLEKILFFAKNTQNFCFLLAGKSKFLNYVLHPYIWSSFVELNELIPNICRVNSEYLHLVSYDLEKYLEKPAINVFFG